MSAGESGRVVPAKYRPKITADFSIDGHSHIRSGTTAPLPLLWAQAGNIPLSRSFIDTLTGLFLPGGRAQRKKTEEIADDLARELENAYKESKLFEEAPYKSAILQQKNDAGNSVPIFSPFIIMPMDMDIHRFDKH